MPPTTPAYIASPPMRGVGKACTSRSRTSASAPTRVANRLASGVNRNVTAAVTRKTSAYSRTGQPNSGARIGRMAPDERPDRFGDFAGGCAVGVADRAGDQPGDFLHPPLGHALRGNGGRADPDAAGHRRRLRVVRDGVLVEHDRGGAAPGFGIPAGDAHLAQVEQ